MTLSIAVLLQTILVAAVIAVTVTAQVDKHNNADYFYVDNKTVMNFMDDNGLQQHWFTNLSGPQVV